MCGLCALCAFCIVKACFMRVLCSVGDNGDVDDDNGPPIYHMSLDIICIAPYQVA